MARIGVVFSSGFFGFFAHAGFLAALRDLGIKSAGYAGASSGAIVAAMAASGIDDNAIKETLFNVRKEDFWDPDPWYVILAKAVTLFRGYRGYLKGERFAQLLRGLPVKKIEDCEIPLAITATNLTNREETNFTRGDLIEAIRASGAVPGLFKPVEIGGSMYVDGGIINKAPVQVLTDLVKPEKIIVHFLTSDNMGDRVNSFLKRRMTPWHIHQLSINISRHEAYQRQCDFVGQQGIDIIEVKTNTPHLGPNRLEYGPQAYRKAREETLKILSKKD
ncbi:patatin-like phospholipase family protein [Thermodesulfobacteriota bacterium]